MDVPEGLRRSLADRYRLERELGQGGMATVYLATDLRHERQVALKVVQPDLAATLGGERFLREIRTTAQLTHPHILPLLDSGEADGTLYYVMPYVEGESLRDRLSREGQLPVEEAVRITREVADALAYAHGHGVVHRDIKPDNILLASGHAVVADFGIARAMHQAGSERLTATGMALGSPAYMSPEQASGVAEVDGRADVYSLGCVLYEALAGTPPFTGPTAESVARQHIAVAPHPVTALRPAVAPGLAEAVHRSLAKVPADRYQTAQEFAAALAAPETRRGSGTRAVRRPRRLRRLVVPAAGAALVVVVAVVAVLHPWARHASAADAAANRVIVLPYDNQTGDSALEPVGRMTAEWITEGLAQTGLVQVVPNLMVVEAVAKRPADGAGPNRLHDLARTMEAGLAVTGSYYAEGDSLEFHSSVLDVGTGIPLGVVAAVRAPRSDPSTAMAQVRSLVMGVLATRLNALSSWENPVSVRPPSYQAALAYNAATRDWLAEDYAAAAEEYRHAYALDTTYLRAAMQAASAYGWAGEPERSDSLLRFVAARKDRLSPYDRLRLEFVQALAVGDRDAALRDARAATALVPIGTARLALVSTLLNAGRPHEAEAHLDTLMHSAFGGAGAAWYPSWLLRRLLLHVLGRYQMELAWSDSAPDSPRHLPRVMEARGEALAALGRVDEVRTLADSALAAPPQRGSNLGTVLEVVANELRAHGHPDAAAEIASRTLDWLRAHDAAGPHDSNWWFMHVQLFCAAGQWDSAAAVLAHLRGDPRAVVPYLGLSAIFAARRGARDSAAVLVARLADLARTKDSVDALAWQARGEAFLGRRAEAVDLLSRALRGGLDFGIDLHRDQFFAPLWGYAPFEALLHPKD
jgi:tRNA A-37 threonylcarbamoyl transferase component Bud32/tetratricopeptide (TPR) repeat protein